MSDMVVMVPSRGRPQNVARLWQAWADTWASADLLVLVDDDDPTLEQYMALDLPMVVSGRRQRIGPLLNEWAMHLVGDYRVVGFMGDDHLPLTPAWDERIRAACGPWSVVYGDDLLQRHRLATAVFMGSALLRELGYMNVPGAHHLYLDDGWMHIGRTLGTLRYLPEVVIEHLHPAARKAPMDALYDEVNSTAMYAADRRAFESWRDDRAAADLARVKAAMQP